MNSFFKHNTSIIKITVSITLFISFLACSFDDALNDDGFRLSELEGLTTCKTCENINGDFRRNY